MSAVKKQEVITFGRAIYNFFTKYFQFSGVATRAEYWWTALFFVIVALGFSFFIGMLAAMIGIAGAGYELIMLLSGLTLIAGMGVILPLFTLMARRLHDVGFSAKILWIVVGLWVLSIISNVFGFSKNITFMGFYFFVSVGLSLFLFVVSLLPSKTTGNPYRK